MLSSPSRWWSTASMLLPSGSSTKARVVAGVVARRSPGGPLSRYPAASASRGRRRRPRCRSAGNAMCTCSVGVPPATSANERSPRATWKRSARSPRISQAERRADRRVEAPGSRRGLRRGSRDGRRSFARARHAVVDGLHAVAVRVEQERPVVVRVVLGAQPGLAVARGSPRRAGAPERVDLVARACAEGRGCSPRVGGRPSSAWAMAEVVPLLEPRVAVGGRPLRAARARSRRTACCERARPP